MDDTLSISDQDDDDSRMQYIRQDFLRPPHNYGDGEDCDDDSSNRFFVSEPSTSEADSSENLMRLGLVSGMGGMDDNLLYLDPSASEEENLLFHLNEQEKNKEGYKGSSQMVLTDPLPAESLLSAKQKTAEVGEKGKNYSSSPPRAVRASPAVYSPDNASLSSYDTASSARGKQKVEVDFLPGAQAHLIRKEAKKETTVSNSGGKPVPTFTPSTLGTKQAEDESRKKKKKKKKNLKNPAVESSHQVETVEDNSSNSSSSASEAQVQQLGEFLDDLRINSEGQMKESSVPGSNTSFDSSILLTRGTEVKDVLRRNNSSGAVNGRRAPATPQQQQQTRYQNISAPSSTNSSGSRLIMDYTKDSFGNYRGAADSIAMTFSTDAGDYGQRQQQQSLLVGDSIEMMTSPPPLTLPPLYAASSAGISGGRKQQHDRHRRWSGDADTKSLNHDQKTPSASEGQDTYHHDNTINNADVNPNTNRNSLKSTIENSRDEWSKQQKEIGLFSQFAIGTRDTDGATQGARRTKQRSYRQLRTNHLRQETGEDSSSQASASDQSSVNFLYSPSQQSPPQPPMDVTYQTAADAVPAPRTLPHGSPPLHGGSTRSFGSFDGVHAPPRHMHQQSPSLQLDPKNAASIPWGNVVMYQSSPTYFFPAPLAPNRQRGNSETALPNQRFHNQYSHTRVNSALPMYERPPDGGNYHFFHSPQHFSTIAPHSETSTMTNQFFPEENNRNRNHSHSYDSRASSVEHDVQKFQMEQQRRDSYSFNDDTSFSVSDHSSDESIEKERGIHLLHDGVSPDKRVIRHHHLDNTIPKFDRSQFLPQTHDNMGENKYPTFVCPNCNMRQREFFTVSSSPRQYEGEGTMISLLFAVYVVSSLYIFGLQEGWGKLDCFYFAVITLTTAGLGDLVPTTDGAKIICSMFIYFGVACIGLLLGSYIAGMLDERSYREAVANQIKACPNCARIKNMRYMAEQRRAEDKLSMERIAEMHATALRTKTPMEKASNNVRRTEDSPQMFRSKVPTSTSMDKEELSTTPKTPSSSFDPASSFESPTVQKQLLGSPMTTQILHRQSHTRHVSMDLRRNDKGKAGGNARKAGGNARVDLNAVHYRNNSVDIHIPATVKEGAQSIYKTKNTTAARNEGKKENQNDDGSINSPPTSQNDVNDDLSTDSSDSDIDSLASEVDEIEGRNTGVRNAKYVILTLQEALVNSLVIIAFGCLGFYLIEGFSFVDSLYFTTVLLTSTGYGDIVPKSDGGKLFATVYLLVGGTILLNNMSMISMIPLELRKRRTEHSVLTQFGDSLDDDALRELATGPLIQRINLGGKDPRGLDECTREMFALAMMIRLGKVTEHDIKLTFAAFRKLDVHNEGILNSKSIIGGMIAKRRRINLTNNARSDQTRYGVSQGYGSWINPPAASFFDGNRYRSSSTHASFIPNPQVNRGNYSEQTPFISMSERGFPQYGINQNQYQYVPTSNE